MKKMMIIFPISILLASCATTSNNSAGENKPSYDANGKQTRMVMCSVYKTENCRQKIGEICKSRGYKIRRHGVRNVITKELYFQCK